jgi:hypothetical protein
LGQTDSIANKRMGDRSKEALSMFSLVLTQKWWLGLVAGIFGVLGVGAALVAMPAFADVGRADPPPTPTPPPALGELSVRLECKKGTWTEGSFRWTLAGEPMGSPVALPACPDGRRRVVTLSNIRTVIPSAPVPVPAGATTAATGSGTGGVTGPATGTATADGFSIRVSGRSDSGGTRAVCDFPSPKVGSRELRQRHVTFTCAADGATRDSDAYMKIKVSWSNRDDDDDGRTSSSVNQGQAQATGGSDDSDDKDDKNKKDNGPDKSTSDDKPGNSQGKDEKRGWLNFFNRGRGP